MLIRKLIITGGILTILLALSIWGSLFIGPATEITPSQIHEAIYQRLFTPSGPETPVSTIVWELRLPRILTAALAGAALSLAGAAFQGLLRNQLADPYIVGTSAGAAVGGVLAIVFNLKGGFLGISAVAVLAFGGALLSMFGIYRLSSIRGRIPVETFLLAGVVVGSFLWAMVSFMLTIANQSLQEAVFWLMGSTQWAGWPGIGMLALYVAAGFIGLMHVSHPLNLITLGDEPAGHLGVDVEKTKLLTIIFASLVTAAAVSVTGLIGFVGLMIPHLARMIAGADHRLVIPFSALGGALFLIWVDTAARTMFSPREIPVGVLTAIMGAPFFLYLLRRNRMDSSF